MWVSVAELEVVVMDIKEKDKEMLFLTDKLCQRHIAFIKSRLFYYQRMVVLLTSASSQIQNLAKSWIVTPIDICARILTDCWESARRSC